MKNAGSLRLRLFLAGAASVVAALALSAIGLNLLFERHVERRALAELTVHLNQVIAGLERDAEGALAVAQTPADPRFQRPLSGLFWQLEAEGAVLRSRSLWDDALALSADTLPDGQIHEHLIAGPDGTALLTLERSVTLSPRLGAVPVRAAVAVNHAEIAAATRAFVADLLPYLLVLALFLIAAAWLQVAVGLRPLAAVRVGIAAIRDGAQKRLGGAFPTEVRPLAAEVDALLEARDGQVARARTRAADLAHGLKTPLQVLSGDVDRLRAQGLEDLADEIDGVANTMRRRVDRELARARIGIAGRDAKSDLRYVAQRVVGVVKRTPDGARLEWTVDVPASLVVRIDADDLTEALGNLVENASRFARSAITVSARRKGETIELSVLDDGPGIPGSKVDAVIDRGARLDTAREGTGLGLAIVDDIVTAWNGRLELVPTAGGLSANLHLPAAKP